MWKETKTTVRKVNNYNPSTPEPYSIESGQQDPEVLGPQTMVKEKDLSPVVLKDSDSNSVEKEFLAVKSNNKEI